MKKMNSSEEIEKTLSSWDKVNKPIVSEGFESSLRQRLSFVPRDRLTVWLRYCAAAMVVMALVNLMLLISSSTETTDSAATANLIYEVVDYTELAYYE